MAIKEVEVLPGYRVRRVLNAFTADAEYVIMTINRKVVAHIIGNTVKPNCKEDGECPQVKQFEYQGFVLAAA